MVYYIYSDDTYILGLSTNDSDIGGNCTAEEYAEVQNALRNAPTPQDGYGLRLRTDLTWEEYELPPEPEPEPSEEEDMRMALEVLGVKP